MKVKYYSSFQLAGQEEEEKMKNNNNSISRASDLQIINSIAAIPDLRFLFILLLGQSWAVLVNPQEELNPGQPNIYYPSAAQHNGYHYQRPQGNQGNTLGTSVPKKSSFGLKLQPYEYNRATEQHVPPRFRPRPQSPVPANQSPNQQQINPLANSHPSNQRQEQPSSSYSQQGSHEDISRINIPPQQQQYPQPAFTGQPSPSIVSNNQPLPSQTSGNFVSTSVQGTFSSSYHRQRPPYSQPGPYPGNNQPNNQERPSYPVQAPHNPGQVTTNGYQYQPNFSRAEEAIQNSQNLETQKSVTQTQAGQNGYQGNFQQNLPGTSQSPQQTKESQENFSRQPKSNFEAYGNQKPVQESSFYSSRPEGYPQPNSPPGQGNSFPVRENSRAPDANLSFPSASQQQNYQRPHQENAVPSGENSMTANGNQDILAGSQEVGQNTYLRSGQESGKVPEQPGSQQNSQDLQQKFEGPNQQGPVQPTVAQNNGYPIENGQNTYPTQGYSYQTQGESIGPRPAQNNGYAGSKDGNIQGQYPQNVYQSQQMPANSASGQNNGYPGQNLHKDAGYSYQSQQDSRQYEQSSMDSALQTNRPQEASTFSLSQGSDAATYPGSGQQNPSQMTQNSEGYLKDMRPNLELSHQPQEVTANPSGSQGTGQPPHQLVGQNSQQNQGYPQAMRPSPQIAYQSQMETTNQSGNQNKGQPPMNFSPQGYPTAVRPDSEITSQSQQGKPETNGNQIMGGTQFSQQFGTQTAQQSSSGAQQQIGSPDANEVTKLPAQPLEIPKPSRQYLPPFSDNEYQTPSPVTLEISTQNQGSLATEAPQTLPQDQGLYSQHQSQNITPQDSLAQEPITTTPNPPETTLATYHGPSHQYLPSPAPQVNDTAIQPFYNTQPWNPIQSNRMPKMESLSLPQGYRYNTPSMKQTAEHVQTHNGVVYNELGMGMTTPNPAVEKAANSTKGGMGKTEIETQEGYTYGRPATELKDPNGITQLRPVDTMPPSYVYYNKQQQQQQGRQNGTQENTGISGQKNKENSMASNQANPNPSRPSDEDRKFLDSNGNFPQGSGSPTATGGPLMPENMSQEQIRQTESAQVAQHSLAPIVPMESGMRPQEPNVEENPAQYQNSGVSVNSEVTKPSQNGYQYPYKQVSALSQVNRIPQEGQQSQPMAPVNQDSGSQNNVGNSQEDSSQFRPSNYPAPQQGSQQYFNGMNTHFQGYPPSNQSLESPREPQMTSQNSLGNQQLPAGTEGNQGGQNQPQIPSRPETNQEPYMQIPVQQSFQVTETQAMIPMFRPSPQFQRNSYNYGTHEGSQMTLQIAQPNLANQNQATGPNQGPFLPSQQNFMVPQSPENPGQNMPTPVMDYPQNPGPMQGYFMPVPQQGFPGAPQNNMIFPQMPYQNPQMANSNISPNLPEISVLQTTTPNTIMSFFATPNPEVIPSPNPVQDSTNNPANRPMTFEETKTYMQMPSHSFELPSSYVMVPGNAEQHLMPEPRIPNQTPSITSEAEEITQNPMVPVETLMVTQEPIRQPHLVYGSPDQPGTTTVSSEPEPQHPSENERNSQMMFLQNPLGYAAPEQAITPVTPGTVSQDPGVTTPESVVAEGNSQNFIPEQPKHQPHLIYGPPVYEPSKHYLPSPYLKK
uniref:Uncharacterized protein n=1 Tax=Musca domestica TaxID=7370 RepID=A0A1I8N588_MUSDO